MYLRHFGLEHKPFAITPDPRFLYLSERHREALAHLLYGVGESGGFVLLTGEVGTGKTTLCRGLIEQLPENTDAALVINPTLSADELLAAICDELGLERAPGAGGKALVDRLNAHLLAAHAAGRRTVLLIDEAQLLCPEAIEQVRLLTNLETRTEKLLQVILIGQPELRDMLARPGLRQVAQRITARYHLEPLGRDEVHAYIDHRLRLAGGDGALFSTGAKDAVDRASRGIPRLVNSLCDRALLGAYAQGAARVDAGIARRAAREVLGEVADPPTRRRLAWAALLVFATAGLAAGLVLWQRPAVPPAVADAPTPPPPATKPHAPAMQVKPLPDSRVAATPEPSPPAANAAETPLGAPHPAVPLSGDAASASTAGEPSPSHGPSATVAKAASTQPPSASGPSSNGADAAGAPPGARPEPPLAEALFDDADTARARLAALWGVEVVPPAANCDALEARGLACFVGQGSWAALAALDRPALLQLTTGTGQETPRYAVVESVAGERITLRLPDGGRGEVAREALLAAWYGRFELLWQLPGVLLLGPGDRGPAVHWVRERLAHAEGATLPLDASTQFDQALRERVRAFQLEHGLEPDGLVGRKTMVQLDLVAGPGPRLVREGG